MKKTIDKNILRIKQTHAAYMEKLFSVNRNDCQILMLYGNKGTGKTTAALEFCRLKQNSRYFSFKNIDAAIAPNIFSDAGTWPDFFEKLKIEYAGKYALLVFDDVDIRNDKDEFYAELKLFCDECEMIFVILIMRKKKELPFETKKLYFDNLTNGDISKLYPHYSREHIFRLFTVTAGIPELVSQYNDSLTYEENLKAFLSAGSRYHRYVEELLSESFRSPESYNTLLYAIATGRHRISEIAEFAGFAYNKCDKYIKALIDAGFVEVIKKKDHRNKLCTNYILANTYLDLWYRWIYPNREKLLTGFSDDMLSEMLQYIDDVLVPKMFKKASISYLKHRHTFGLTNKINIDKCRDILLDGVHFDFVQPVGYGHLFVKITPEFNNKFSKESWEEIVKASVELSPFYDNYYILFQNSRFTDYFWDKSKEIENLKLIQPEWLRY